MTLVGEGGQAYGLDHDAEMIANAQQNAEQANLSGVTTFQAGDANQLDFQDNFFDACRSERMLQHLPDPEKSVAEMIRVTKPGGRIVIADTDYSSTSSDSRDIDMEWRYRRALAESVANGYAGRQTYGWLKKQGVVELEKNDPSTAGKERIA